MPDPWTQFAKAGVAVLSLLALLGLIPHVQFGVAHGWPGGFFPHLGASLASWFGGLHWYLPAAALAGGVALAASHPSRRWPRLREVVLAASLLATASFALQGFIGPQLEHYARLGLLDPAIQQHAELAATLQPNDWIYLRGLMGQESAQGNDVSGLVAMVHSTIAFAILSAIMLPLGIAIGNGGRGFHSASRRRAAWGMAAGTIAVVYGAQIGAWRVAVTGEVWPVPLVYSGFLTVPLVVLLTLVWSGADWPPTGASQGSPAPEATG